ncbi:holin-like protein [Weissella uvarum]|uniref:CidA/LrgA family protein n=1 Tax=Weissella uvarum TaxID=1479233 RepID=UPI001EF7CDCB|nr:CidA/LrgA family protein [Weissella uvarum]MBM7616572.1 holin-like protein [Weissella uvarum]
MQGLTKMTKAFFIYATILFISYCLQYGIGMIAPEFPAPAPLIGLILLFLALQFGIVKLESVDNMASTLMALTGFLFVPSGISIINSIDVIKHDGIKLLIIIAIATVVMLISVAYTAQLIFSRRREALDAEVEKELN